MKKLILAVTVAAFAVAAQAGGEGCAASKDKAACCAAKDGKTQVSAQKEAKSECSAAKQVKGECSAAKQVSATKQGTGCCAAKEVKQVSLQSPKAAANKN